MAQFDDLDTKSPQVPPDETPPETVTPSGAAGGSSPAPLPVGVRVAGENESFQLTQVTYIEYGAGNNFNVKILAPGNYTCNNTTFGDAASGQVKACYASSPPSSFLTLEGGTFTLTQQTIVRYGIITSQEETVVSKTLLPGTYTCSTQEFGSDPKVGVVKACYRPSSTSTTSTNTLTSTQTFLINNFRIAGANRQFNFEKYTTTNIPPFKLIVSNSSATNGIQFYYTASAGTEYRVIITSGSTPITEANPVVLYPKSGSNISSVELIANIDVNNLNNYPFETDQEGNQLVTPINFNLVFLEQTETPQPVYEINTLTSAWRDLTRRGNDGIGDGYEESSEKQNTIYYTRQKLVEKKQKLQSFKQFLVKGGMRYRANTNYWDGDSTRAEKQRGYKILLYAVLHPSKFPLVNFQSLLPSIQEGGTESFTGEGTYSSWGIPIADANIEKWFWWDNLSLFENSLREGTYAVELIDKYIKLIDDILDERESVGSTLSEIKVSYKPNESSRVTTKVGEIDIDIVRTKYSISSAILSASKALVDLKTIQFFDEKREYKTVLNFGDDQQYLVEAWRPIPSDSSSIQLKLTSPLDQFVNQYDTAYIVRDVAKTVIDSVNFELVPEQDTTFVLRPANLNVDKFSNNKQSVNNITLSTLSLQTGSVGNISGSVISYDDRVFNRWYTADFNSSELNVDFSDYNNFVFFGSAKARLDAFANKLQKIQSYGDIRINNSTSTVSERVRALEVEYIKRNFDTYEQYLYFASQSNAYSASAYYVDGGIEYNATGSWPKDNSMKPLSYGDVQSWYSIQSAIAERFDEFNPNYLVKHLPEHIQEDVNSTDFIKFIQMFGHVMDNIKVYVDQFSNIYSTTPDPFDGLTMDQVYEVANSFGLQLPNAYSLESLQSFVSSLYDGEGARSLVAETWKRFIHSSIYLRKLKGSRTGTDAVLSAYGLNSPLVQVKESTYAIEGNYIKSDETVYSLLMTGSVSSSVRIPFVSSSYSASNIQIRFNPEVRQQSSLLTTDGTWGIDLVPHPSSSTNIMFNASSSIGGTSYFTLLPPTIKYGRLEVVSGSGRSVIASSSYFPLFSDTYTHIMLRSESQDLTIIQTDGDQILHQETASVVLGSLWNTTYVYLGGTGSIRYGNYDGIIDDLRVWGENTTTDNFIKQAYDPGTYFGNNYSSSYNSLYVDLSFSQKYAAITQSATNESPFYDVQKLSNLPTTGLTTSSYVRILRTIKQFTPIVGSSIFSNRKVTVAPAPVFDGQFVDDSGTKTLKLNSSIKLLEDKKYVGGEDYVQFAISPIDFINQTIIRSMGDVDTNYLIGSPQKFNSDTYTELNEVFEFFLKNYNETINPNEYIRFFKNVLKGPTEYIENYVPARTKLVDGVVIESPMLQRTKTRIQKSIKVDGSNTIAFDKFVAGSGSSTASVNYNVGAYDFFAHYTQGAPENTTVITNPFPIIQKVGSSYVTSSLASTNGGIGMVDMVIEFTSSVGPVSSTLPSKLPPGKRLIQKIGTANLTASYASSSLADRNSGIGFVDANIDAAAKDFVSQSGYPRNPYLGLRTSADTSIYRIPSEVNTLAPFYEILPTSDFSDVGTTTYFYNKSGLYWLPNLLSSAKERLINKHLYRTKLNVSMGETPSTISREFANITLLEPQLLTDRPGRSSVTISEKTYTATAYRGVLNIANIVSLYSVSGKSGLRLRLYRTQEEQIADISRNFSILPAPTAGVLFDGLLVGDTETFPYTLIQTADSVLYFTVDNVTGNDISSTIKLTYFEYEPANLIPQGYLAKHYKFTRTNNIAQRRKSHLGCRLVYCPEGCPPDVTDPNNKTGKVLPRRNANGTISMPELLVESDSPVQVFSSPRTGPVVNTSGGGNTSNTQKESKGKLK